MCSSAFRVLAAAVVVVAVVDASVGAAAGPGAVMTFARVFAVRWRCQNATDTDECPHPHPHPHLQSPSQSQSTSRSLPWSAQWRASVLMILPIVACCGWAFEVCFSCYLPLLPPASCPLTAAAAWHVCSTVCVYYFVVLLLFWGCHKIIL